MPKVNPVCLGASVSDPTEVFVKHRVEARPLRGVERDQRIVRRLGDCEVHGTLMGWNTQPPVSRHHRARPSLAWTIREDFVFAQDRPEFRRVSTRCSRTLLKTNPG